MSLRWQRWLRTFNTIRHLQPRQAWYFFLRRGIGFSKVKTSASRVTHNSVSLPSVLQINHAESDYSNYSFTFLNRTLTFSSDAMNWCPTETQRLWRYNLHYFDFLRETDRPLAQKIALIDDWITHNPQGSEPAWEPYTVSLRIVNWCLFFWSLPQAQISSQWLQSLHLQARWLERNLELHILANHYFENVKAMLFAGLFFDDNSSIQWRKHFQKELIEQLKEQTLADGGHYERSPQYHCILLEGYLDIYALLQENAKFIAPETIGTLAHTINAGLKFLSIIATPDDAIPLFNDSANDVASPPSAIFTKARQLGFLIDALQETLIDLPESGLFGWKSNRDYFLIDCGNIGPNYQPGHTHCDFLSFVLMIDNQWIVVDSGVCEYEPGAMRNYVRSTAAHNTVIIDGCEQSEIWGEFRVARRANRIDVQIHKDGRNIFFEGSYNGFPELKANIIHRRSASLFLSESGKILSVKIIDQIAGDNIKPIYHVESLLHLHPSLECKMLGQRKIAIAHQQQEKDLLVLIGLSSEEQATSWYCPQFGTAIPNQSLYVATDSTLPTELSYEIKVVH